MGRRFDGKAAIVTGSSSGIGKATALRLAAQGAAVCVVANHNVEGAEATVREIADGGGRAVFVHADVSQADDGTRIVADTLGAFGRVDVLVNNAGITRGAPLDQLDEALWDLVLGTNLKSAYLMSRAAVPDMLSRGWGAVVNISSVHAEQTYPRYAVYAASKAGLGGLTRGLALEFGSRGIRFNCILPGTIDISIHSRRNAPVDRSAWQPRASDTQVMKRCGSPDEIAAAVCFLASDESSFVNGATLAVDGGQLGLFKDH
ncbi:MAG: 3-oxoacyl-ACP reductase FabG [Candidatus Brocadiae bacterium]|nr:3-oxoacyl-ACP reductase FabG [Candidatus Brocadiia bacterium]